ncbi:hypothetical protein HII12_004779 [Brettanomyces bruxellensis]|uniref:SCD domain-containing protein n=1 Tax=Dekkera bruxellensis TaxID=5007 RepID=A0A8H6B7T8_DEKBR|nr:hypothetical protein HII12_004779 [Brettanomyces bruxellensis]
MTLESPEDDADTSIGSRLRRTNRNIRKRRAVEDSEDESEIISDDEGNNEAGNAVSVDDAADLSSEDEYRPAQNKKRGGRKKRRIARSNHDEQLSNEGLRNVSGNIDEVEDFEENKIFEALSNSAKPVFELATEWIEAFTDQGEESENKKFDAVKDFVNFVLRSCGCVSLVKRHDVVDPDRADQTVTEVQELFLSQKQHEYPLGLGSNASIPEWKGFRARAAEFVEQIVFIASERGILYENDDFIDTIVSWLGSMSTVGERSLRFTATFYSLQLETTLCKIYTQSSTFIARCQRQLTSETKNLERLKSMARKPRNAKQREEAIQHRIEMISDNSLSYTKKRGILEKLVKDVFSTFFVHRYKDTNPQLRKECIANLGIWVKELPELFFKPVYLRYFGWLLTDPKASVRLQVLKSLIPLYQRPNSASALRQFTRHFKETFIGMAVHESDTSVKVSAISLLGEMVKNSFLEDDETRKISSLIFNENEVDEGGERTIKELARFVSAVEQEKYSEFMEVRGSSLKSLKKSISLNLNDMLKFKLLFKVLDEGHQYYLNSGEVDGSEYEKLRQIAEALFIIPRYNMKNESLEFLISYILFDSSSVTEWSGTVRSSLELSTWDTTMILAFIYGITSSFVKESSTYRIVMSRRFHRNLSDIKDREYYLVKIITSLPKIISLVSTDVSSLAFASLIFCDLIKGESSGTNTFRETNQESLLVEIALLLLQYYAEADLPFTTLETDSQSYANSEAYPIGLFFQCLTDDYTEINIKIDSMLVGLHETLISSLDNTKLSEATNTVLKLLLIMQGDLPFDKVSKLFVGDVENLSKFVKSAVYSEHEDMENKKSFFVAIFDFLCRIITHTLIEVAISSPESLIQTENEQLEMYTERLSKAQVILETLESIIEDGDIGVFYKIAALKRWAEVYSFLQMVNKHCVVQYAAGSEGAEVLKRVFSDPIRGLNLEEKIPGSLEETLVSLFVSIETKYGEASGLLGDLTGDQSDTTETSTEEQNLLRYQLVMAGRALEMLAACDVFNGDVKFRVEKNKDTLGELYKKEIGNAYQEVEKLGKYLDHPTELDGLDANGDDEA